MRRLLVTAVVVGALVVGAGLVWHKLKTSFADLLDDDTNTCTATTSTLSSRLGIEQAQNAALIAGVAARRGLPPRAVTIALATAMQESKLQNLSGGDRDSLGLFQQRSSQGWGTPAQIMDPVHATNAFYDALLRYAPHYLTRPIGESAQKVQRSADFDEGPSYASHEADARAFASALTGGSAHALSCTIPKPTESHPAYATNEVSGFFGAGVGTPVSAGTSVMFPIDGSDALGWATAQYLVAQSARMGIVEVSYDSWSWTYNHGWKQTDTGKAGVVALFVS